MAAIGRIKAKGKARDRARESRGKELKGTGVILDKRWPFALSSVAYRGRPKKETSESKGSQKSEK
jgi:hypothetical protein